MRNSVWITAAFSFGLCIASFARADRTIVDDYVNGSVGGFDPALNYTSQVIQTAARKFITHSPDFALFTGQSNVGTVTFNLLGGESADYASIDMQDLSGGAPGSKVQFIGTTGSVTFSRLNQTYATFNTSGQNLGQITSIKLFAFLESYYDNLIVHIIPEPTPLWAANLWALLLLRRPDHS